MKPTQLPSGSWRCRVYLGKDPQGKPKYQSITRLDYYDCLEAAAKLAKHHHESERDNGLLTLGEAIDKYISLKDGILSPSTIRSYTSMRQHHFQRLMDVPLKNISKNLVQSVVNEESKTFAPKTVLNNYRLLTAVLTQFTNTKISVTLNEPEERDVNTLTEEQLRQLVLALQGDKSEIPLLMALFLGMRRSEIMALTHEDFDPTTNQISITKAMVPDKTGQYVVKSTKTKKSRRRITVPKYLADRLNAAIERGEPFYNVAPERPYKRLQKLCERLGLPHMSMHDLRHQNASIMLSLNIPDKYAMERGGWSSTRTMKSIYQHTMSDERMAVEEQMNEYMERLVPGEKEGPV